MTFAPGQTLTAAEMNLLVPPNAGLLGGTGTTFATVAVGNNLTLASGTLNASAGTGVSSVVAGAGLAGGTITSTGTLSLGTIAAGDLMGNSGTVGAVPGGVAIGANLTLASGTLSASAGSGVTSVATGAGLTGGPITAGGTVSLANVNAATLLGNSGTVSAAPSAIAVGANLTLTAGTLTATAGVGATSADHGAALNSGTIQSELSVTLAGTAGGTLTIAPGSGTKVSVVNLPSAGGTVTLGYAGTYAYQSSRIHLKQGATASVVVLNSGTAGGFVFGTSGGPSSFTATPTAGVIDEIAIEGPTTAYARVLAAAQGFAA